jgi:transcriptional accessory protein Tex/SPT6
MDTTNKSLNVDVLLPKMVLQGVVKQKEAKGYFVELGLKDKTQAFASASEGVEEGDLVFVKVTSVNAASKIVKCSILSQQGMALQVEEQDAIAYSKELAFNSIKPGFLVNCKVLRILDNGIKVSFLSGIEGTIFIDHLTQAAKAYKIGDKVQARVIEVDVITKRICLSLKEHLVNFQVCEFDDITLGQKFDRSVVSRVLYGNSYLIYLGAGQLGFLHKTQAATSDEGSKNEELKADQELGQVRVKELNYFDGLAILSNKEEVLTSTALQYSSLTAG